MQLVINIEKRHFVILVALISLLGIFMIGTATDVNTNDAWHPLQQIARNSSDMTSIDQDENKRIDEADKSYGLDAESDTDMNDNSINNLDRVTGTGGNDIIFDDRPRSENGLYIRGGTAYFNGEIHTDVLQNRGGSSIRLDGNFNMNNNDISNTDVLSFRNHEWGDRSTDGGVYWDKSAGLYVRSSNAPNSNNNGRLLWSGANVHEGSNIDISYDGEDEPTISASGGGSMTCHYDHVNCGGWARCKSDYLLLNIASSDGGDHGDIKSIDWGFGGKVRQHGCTSGTGVYIICCKMTGGGSLNWEGSG